MTTLAPPVIPAGRLRDQTQPRLSAGDLLLRPFEPADAPMLVEAYGDPVIQRWHVASLNAEEAREWVAEREANWAAEKSVDWVVEREGVAVGRVGFREFDLIDGRAETIYWVLPEQRGRGVAASALRAATGWMFEIGFHRLEVMHSLENAGSCRVAERAGYQLEGVLRQRMLHADGWHDVHMHARLEGDPA